MGDNTLHILITYKHMLLKYVMFLVVKIKLSNITRSNYV